MNLTFKIEPWMAALKPFVGSRDKENIAFPWLQIKSGNLFLCATNGHMVAIVEMIDYRAEVADQPDETVYIPNELFKKATVATLNGSNWAPDFETPDHYGTPPDVWQVIPKKKKTFKGINNDGEAKFAVSPAYLKDCATLFEKMFGKEKAPKIIFHLGETHLDPILMNEGGNDSFAVNVVLMPIRI